MAAHCKPFDCKIHFQMACSSARSYRDHVSGAATHLTFHIHLPDFSGCRWQALMLPNHQAPTRAHPGLPEARDEGGESSLTRMSRLQARHCTQYLVRMKGQSPQSQPACTQEPPPEDASLQCSAEKGGKGKESLALLHFNHLAGDPRPSRVHG